MSLQVREQPSFIGTALGTLMSTVMARQQAKREQEAKLKEILATAFAKEQATAAYPTAEEQGKRRMLAMAQEAGQVPEPMGGFSRAEQEHPNFPEVRQSLTDAARQRELGFLNYLSPRNATTLADGLAYRIENDMAVPLTTETGETIRTRGNRILSPRLSPEDFAERYKAKHGAEMEALPDREEEARRIEIAKGMGSTDPEISKRKGAAKAMEQSFASSEKLGQAIRRLNVINRQFKEALPSGDKSALQQRIAGSIAVIGAKLGLKSNPQLLALQSNIRPMAINLIRLFGESGNLSESEQKGAIDAIDQVGLTDDERIAKLRQFAEYAIAGAPPEALNYLMQQPDIRQIVDAFGINLGRQSTQSVPAQPGMENTANQVGRFLIEED